MQVIKKEDWNRDKINEIESKQERCSTHTRKKGE